MFIGGSLTGETMVALSGLSGVAPWAAVRCRGDCVRAPSFLLSSLLLLPSVRWSPLGDSGGGRSLRMSLMEIVTELKQRSGHCLLLGVNEARGRRRLGGVQHLDG